MGILCDFSQKEPVSFYDIISMLNKAQKNSMSHELNDKDVRRSMEIFDHYKNKGERVYLTCYGGYTFKGFKWPCFCTRLVITRQTVTVSRIKAIEKQYGKGPRFIVDILHTPLTGEALLYGMPGASLALSGPVHYQVIFHR